MYTFKEIIYHYPSIKNQPNKNYSFWLRLEDKCIVIVPEAFCLGEPPGNGRRPQGRRT